MTFENSVLYIKFKTYGNMWKRIIAAVWLCSDILVNMMQTNVASATFVLKEKKVILRYLLNTKNILNAVKGQSPIKLKDLLNMFSAIQKDAVLVALKELEGELQLTIDHELIYAIPD